MIADSVAIVGTRLSLVDRIVCGRNAFTDAVKWTPIGGLMEAQLVTHSPNQPNQIQYRPTLESTAGLIWPALQPSNTRVLMTQ